MKIHKSLAHVIPEPLLILLRNTRGRIGFAIVLFFVLMASIGPTLIPLDIKSHPSDIYLPPSQKHPLGTDYAGRDVLSLIVHGSRNCLLIGLLTGFFTLLVGIPVGISSGYIGGKMDSALMFLVDIILTIPRIPLIMVLALSLREIINPFILAAILGITSWAGLAREIRSRVLALKEEGFIEAAEVLGLSNLHIIFREMLPNILSYIAITYIREIISSIYAYVGIFFLGVLPYEPANWGIMLNRALSEGALYTTRATHYLLAPLISILLLQTGLIFLAGGLESVFNPRLRER